MLLLPGDLNQNQPVCGSRAPVTAAVWPNMPDLASVRGSLPTAWLLVSSRHLCRYIVGMTGFRSTDLTVPSITWERNSYTKD